MAKNEAAEKLFSVWSLKLINPSGIISERDKWLTMSFNQVRNVLLLVLLAAVQFQIFAGDQGFGVRAQLKEELVEMKAENKRLSAYNERLSQGSINKHSDELRQEALRQVYHMVAPGESFEKL